MDFNQKVRPTGDPSYLTSSKEPSRNDFRNESLGTLFDGIGNLVGQGTKVLDERNVRNAQEDLYTAYDKRLSEQGVDLAVDAVNVEEGSKGGKPSPPALGDLQNRMSRLKAAQEAGAISNIDFEARLTADVRAIRQKYPGYREEVDNMMKSIAGIDPANSLRRSLLSELLSNQSQAQAEKAAEEKFYDSEAGHLPPDFWARKQSGKPYSFSQVRAYVGEQKRWKTALEADMQSMKHKLSTEEVSSIEAKSVANSMASTLIQENINKAYETGIVKQLKEFAIRGETIPPELHAQALVLMNDLENTSNIAIDKLLIETQGTNGKNLHSIMGNAGVDELKKTVTAQITQFIKYIDNKDYGMLALNARANEAAQSAGARELAKKYPVLKTMQQLNGLGEAGKTFVQMVLTRPDNTLMNVGVAAVKEMLLLDSASGGTKPISEKMKDTQELEKQNPSLRGASKEVLFSHIEKLADPKVDPKIKGNIAKTIFNANELHFLQKFDKKEQTDLLTRMASPEVTKQIRDTGDKKLWSDYQRWSVNSFFNVFRNEASTVKDSVNREWYDVNWDEKSNQFTVSVSQAGLRAAKEMGSVGMNPLNTIERSMSSNLQEQVEKINRGIKVIEPILKEDGMNVGKEMGNLLRHQGIMPGAKEESFFGKMRKAWDRAMTPMTQEDRNAENPLTFGGNPINFTKPQGGDSGASGRTLSNYLQSGVDQLDPGTKKMFEGLKEAGVISDANLRSAFRSPGSNARAGGAKGSKHIEGKAIDLDVRDYSDEQKTALLEAAIANGARGIGIYPGGRSIHIDTREIPVTWGSSPAGSYKGVSWQEQPKWAQGPLRKLFEQAEGVNAIQRATKGGSGGGGGGGGGDLPRDSAITPMKDMDKLPEVLDSEGNKHRPWVNTFESKNDKGELTGEGLRDTFNLHGKNKDREITSDEVFKAVRQWGSGYGVTPGMYFSDKDIERYPELKKIIEDIPGDIEAKRLKHGYHLVTQAIM